MTYPAHVSSSGKQPVLVIDRNNILGSELAKKFSSHATVVLVSETQTPFDEAVIFIPFGTVVPRIPDSIYTAIFFVWDAKDKDLLEPLIKKANNQNARFFLIVDKENRKAAEEKLKSFSEEVLLVLGDMFGTGVTSVLQNFLLSTKTAKKITLSHMGLHLWYPVLRQDVADKIEELLFSQDHKKGKFFAGPKHPLTALRLAHSLQKIDPAIFIDFSKGSQKEIFPEDHEKGHALFEEYDSIEKIQHIYKGIVAAKKRDSKETGAVVFARSAKKTGKFPWTIYIVYVLLILLSLPFFSSLVLSGAGGILLSSGLSDMQKGNMPAAQQKVTASAQNFSLAKDALSVTEAELSVIGKESLTNYLQKEIDLGYQSSQIAEDGVGIFQRMSGILQGKTLSPKTDAEEVVRIAKHMSLLMQEVHLQDVPKQYQSSFQDLLKISEISDGVVDELPVVLGVTQEKSYLVLFQNNMELRPGGGFIGSYGLLKLKNGAVKEFSIHDVYDADGQLQGHVEPPFAIRRYIPIVHLFLRDSNFDVDFTKNAQTAAFLLSQETGDKVDGVMGIDLETVRSALAAVHGVFVPSYNETVTDKNFFTLIEKYVEKNTFPGSVQKKEFLSAFFSAFADSFKTQKVIDAKTLLNSITGLIEGKHILVVFSDPVLQLPFSLSNLSGSLPDTLASSSAGIHDFIGISEANLGINKVNAFVTRKLSQQLSIDEKGNITENTILSLTNTSDGTWPGGEYRNYIRFILPQGTVLKDIAIDGIHQHIVDAVTNPRIYEGNGFVPPVGLEVEKETEDNKILFGFLVTIAQKSTRTISLTYSLANTLDMSKPEQQYDLLVWKQPGIGEYPYTLVVDLPNSRGILQASVPVVTHTQEVSYKTDIAQDTNISLSLTAK